MPPAFCAVKAKATKNWQSQHLITLKVFVRETLRKRIALVSLQTALAQINYDWNDRCLCCVFLYFYSAIFQLTSAKFQTFAYNYRTVWSSYKKFGQQFEINELYVCTKFRGNRSRDFGFRTGKPPRKFGIKSDLSQKRPKYGKKYFLWLYVLSYPFIPTNPLLAAMKFFFFLFFLPKFCMLFFS